VRLRVVVSGSNAMRHATLDMWFVTMGVYVYFDLFSVRVRV